MILKEKRKDNEGLTGLETNWFNKSFLKLSMTTTG